MIWHPGWARVLRWTIVAVGAIVVVSIGLLTFSPTLDLGFLEERVEESLSSQLGIEVSLASLKVTVGFRAGVQVRDLRLEAPAAEPSQREILTADFARLRLGLLPLLRRRLDIHLVEIEGVRASVDAWQAIEGVHGDEEPGASESDWEIVGIETLSLRDLEIEVGGVENAEPAVIRVASLEGRAARDRPLELAVEGTLEGGFGGLPFAASFSSGTLRSLIESPALLLTGTGSVGEVELEVDGSVDLEGDEWTLEADLGLAASDLARLGDLWGGDLPGVGPLRASGRVIVRNSLVSVGGLQLTLGESSGRGQLQVDLKGPRPAISGRLEIDSVDVREWDSEPLDVETILSMDLSSVGSLLAALDATLALEVARVEGFPLEVADLNISTSLSEGVLVVPLSTLIAGSTLSGSLRLRGGDEGIEVEVDLAALEAHKLLADEAGLLVPHTRVAASLSGSTPRQLLDSMAIELSAEDVALDYLGRDDQMIPVRWSHVGLQKRGGVVDVSATGSLSEAPVAIEATVGLPPGLDRHEVWPWKIEARLALTELQLEGEVIPRPGDLELASRFEVRGELSSASDVSFDVEGRQSFSDGRLHLVLEQGRLGRSTLTGELTAGESTEGEIPRLTIHSPWIDLDEIRGLLPSEGEVVKESGRIDFDIAILPAGVELIDADVDVTIAHLEREIADLEQIQASLRVRDGRLLPSEFRLVDGSTLFEGQASMDLRGDEPRLRLELAADQVDLGALLGRHGLARGFNLESGRLWLALVARGSSLRELVTRSALEARAEDVLLELETTGLGRPLRIELERIELSAVEGESARLDLEGTFDQIPVELHLEIDAGEGRNPGESLPVRMTSEIGAASLILDTQVRLPFDLARMEHHFVLQGDDLFALLEPNGEQLLRTGPFRLEAVIESEPDVISLSGVRLDTGESVLEGAGAVRAEGGIPVIDLGISSERLVLEDFVGPGFKARLEGATRELVDVPEVEVESVPVWDVARLREALRSLGASVELDLGAVLLGGERLGSGGLSLDLDDGVLEVTLEASQANGGSSTLGLRLDTAGGQVAGNLWAATENLDFGTVIERLRLEDLNGGRLALDLEASFDGATLPEALASASGHFDATYYPEGGRTKLLDLWAGGLFQAVLPVPGSEPSAMNCVVAWFTIDQGRMTPDAFYLDTSRMRARGSGTIDLPTGELDLKLSPRPKSRTFLNLATPVRVLGTWDDPTIRFTQGGLAGTMLKLYLWAITVWRDMTRRPLPRDGSDICLDPPSRAAAEEQMLALQ